MRNYILPILIISILTNSCSQKGEKQETSIQMNQLEVSDFPWMEDEKIIAFEYEKSIVIKPITKALLNHLIKSTPDSLIPINLFRYENLPFLSGQDTILPDGWKIQFMVKKDSTRYSDVYIRCTKSEKKYVFFCEEFPSFRPCYMPRLAGSNTDYIYFLSGCVTTQNVLMVLDKNQPENSETYSPVIDFDIKTNKVVEWFSRDDSDLIIRDICSGKTVSIKYKNECSDPGNWSSHCVDSVRFSSGKITIYTTSGEIYYASF